LISADKALRRGRCPPCRNLTASPKNFQRSVDTPEFVEEILSIDAKLLELIQEKSGLVSSAVQPYLWRAASHFRIMKLAFQGKLDNDPQRYAHCVYPQQLDEIIELEIKRIHGRIDLIQSNPMVLHPPAAELAIPDHLKLSGWPGSSGKP